MKLFVLAGICISKNFDGSFFVPYLYFNFSTNEFIKKHVVLLVCME